MTANRKWVKFIARWLARVDGVTGQIRLAMLSLTGISTMSLSLREFGYSHLVWPIVSIMAIGLAVYTYLYTEGGVWNQVSRDKSDLSNNYAAPSMAIDDMVIGVAVFVAINGRPPTPEEKQLIVDSVTDMWRDQREGLEL